MRTAILFAAALCGTPLFGQMPVPASPKPIQAKRTPPAKSAAPSSVQNYNFGAQLQALQDPGTAVAGDAVRANGEVPKDFHLRTDVPLSATAAEAVRVSETWRGEQNTPAAGPDGRVLYSFGAGLPVVVCAPLRVCIIEMQAGEKIVGEPQIGDAVRWNIAPAMYGTGDQTTSVIVLKPQDTGLDTNLLITTDRRAYYVRLVSKPNDYVARVAFRYPEEDSNQKWQQHLAEQSDAERTAKREAQLSPAVIAVEKLNFSYSITGGNEHIRPVRVFDDGSKTYIQMLAEMQNREAPVLVVLGTDGKGEMTNYRVRDQTYIVDRLFDRAQLVLGTGKKAQKVEISRERPKG